MKRADVLLPVGRVLRSEGTDGELKIKPFGDFGLEDVRSVVLKQRGRMEGIEVISVRSRRGSRFIKLRGIDSLEAAEALRGAEILVPAIDLIPPGGDAFHPQQLVGCRVSTVSGDAVGMVTDVIPVGESGLLVVSREGGEAMIPLAADICREIRPEEGLIVVDPPDGLLDLNEI